MSTECAALASGVGKAIETIVAHPLPFEVDYEQLSQGYLYSGGGCRLVFSDGTEVFATWSNPAPYLLAFTSESAWYPYATASVPLAHFDHWSDLVGAELAEAVIYGKDGAPYEAELRFRNPSDATLPGQILRLAIGHCSEDGEDVFAVGDGDDFGMTVDSRRLDPVDLSVIAVLPANRQTGTQSHAS